MRCPSCDSPAPHLHPAVQYEGEVQPCNDDFHRKVTSQNTPKRIAENDRLLSEFTAAVANSSERLMAAEADALATGHGAAVTTEEVGSA